MGQPWLKYQPQTQGASQPATDAPWLKYQPQAPSQPQQSYADGKGDIPSDPSWTDLPGNILPSAGNLLYSIGDAALHPVRTAEGIDNLMTGAALKVDKLARDNLPAGVVKALDTADSYAPGFVKQNPVTQAQADPQKAEQATQTADAFWSMIKDRYGTPENFKKTLIKDPVGFAADISTLATGVGGGIKAVATQGGRLAEVGNAISKVGNAANPLAIPVNAAKAVAVSRPAAAVGRGAAELAGLPSGVGGESIVQAIKTGYEGGPKAQAFRENMRGNVPQDAVLDEARTALGNIADERSKNYQLGMVQTKASTAPMSYQPIETAMGDLVDTLFHGPVQKTDDASIKLVSKVGETIDSWKQAYPNPTPHDFDQLKQAIDKLKPNFSAVSGDQERIITTMRNAVKDEILAADPGYAKTMKDYETSKATQREIEQALSLNKKSSKDTALRKVQSVMRNNANTNYGSRVDNVALLEKHGGKNMMAALAGQQMNSLAPRGLARLVPGAALYMANPTNALSAIAAAAASSPRVVGEISHAAGRAGRVARHVPKVPLNALTALGSTLVQKHSE